MIRGHDKKSASFHKEIFEQFLYGEPIAKRFAIIFGVVYPLFQLKSTQEPDEPEKFHPAACDKQ